MSDTWDLEHEQAVTDFGESATPEVEADYRGVLAAVARFRAEGRTEQDADWQRLQPALVNLEYFRLLAYLRRRDPDGVSPDPPDPRRQPGADRIRDSGRAAGQIRTPRRIPGPGCRPRDCRVARSRSAAGRGPHPRAPYFLCSHHEQPSAHPEGFFVRALRSPNPKS